MNWRDRWRALLVKAITPTVRGDPTSGSFDGLPIPATSQEQSPLQALLNDIETTALAIYAVHGFPDQQGHYARKSETDAWTFISEHLTPAERFALVEANPPEKGWRFGRLQDLGLQSGDNLLVTAGKLLDGVAKLRTIGLMTEDDFLAAIRLGETWRAVREHPPPRFSRLVLTAPENRN